MSDGLRTAQKRTHEHSQEWLCHNKRLLPWDAVDHAYTDQDGGGKGDQDGPGVK